MDFLKKMMVLLNLMLLLVSFCNGQDSTDLFFKKISNIFTDASNLSPYLTCKVKSIIVKDNRPDTVSIGLYKDGLGNNHRLVFNKGQTLQSFFESNLTNDSSLTEVYVVINHLFVSNNPLTEEDANKFKALGKFYRGKITFQAKVYILQQGSYRGLIKIDTTFISTQNIERAFTPLLENVLSYTSYNIGQSLLAGNFNRHPKLSKELVDSINTPSYFTAAFNGSDSGYFTSYADFMNNNLTKANFEVKQLQEGCYYLYTKDKNGVETLEHNVWGVKKGSIVYIMDKNLLFPLIKKDNAYYWNGLFKFVERHGFVPIIVPVAGGFVNGVEQVGTSIKVKYVPCLLNMQTGVRY